MKTALRILLLPILLLCLATAAQATHIYSGYISHTSDPQNPRRFDFTLTVYTLTASPAEDPFVYISMGDGTILRVNREKIVRYNSRYDQEIFTWSFTYDLPGNYTVKWIAENRNGGIINLPAPSDQLTFHAITHLQVNMSTPNMNSPKLAGVPLAAVHTGEPWTHNLLAYDVDGDYLVYELVPPKHRYPDGVSKNILGYQFPPGLTINEFGELHWENPQAKGQHVIVVRVTEMRNGRVLGSMEVEMSFTVTDRTYQTTLELLNKDHLTVNDDGSIQTWPGQKVKLEFYLRESPGSDLPLSAKAFGEIDTLELTDTSLAFRDTLDGFAVTYTFTPTPAMERTEPYLIGLRGRLLRDKPDYTNHFTVDDDWAFAYLYVGEQRRPLSPGEEPEVTQTKLYPNPATDAFVVEAPNLANLYLQLRDVNGQEVTGYTLQPGRNTLSRPIGLASGLYFYTLMSGSDIISSGKLVFL
ncbi:T9SS type A sorting domain-containing protein [Pontibacter roseus]|uniref:T9SS type A sorting domain-containing protein n=1 Tax=Pontibacter roseus TaxID=336989 RepID=UPI000370EDBF|nr:T9SS type A sorting domain-containing protein [Pontibacter roseus]